MKLDRGWLRIAQLALVLGLLGLWPASGRAQPDKSEPHPTPPPTEEEAEEAERTVTFGVDLDLVSKYVWRGTNLNDDFSIQPGVWVSAYGFTASAWFQFASEGNFDENDEQQSFEEVDLSLGYEHTFDKITVGGGIIHYAYPNFDDIESSNELYVTAGYDTFIAPSVGVYRDLDVESWYLELGIGPEFSLAEKLTVGPGVVASLYSFDIEDSQTLNRIEPSVALNYDIGSGLSATAHVHYVITLDDEAEGFYENQFWGGVGLHYEF